MQAKYSLLFTAVFLGYNQYWPGGLWFCGFMSRSTRRLIGSGSDFKASQKTGLRRDPTNVTVLVYKSVYRPNFLIIRACV